MKQWLVDQWQHLEPTFAAPTTSLSQFCFSLLLGGLLAMFIRFLYRRTSPQAGGDSIAKVFPLLTLVTIAVITVVKSSLALSLGLVGALSIVRFRAAIKDPEELVYLFLCIGVGLTLGAQQLWLAIALVGVATVFVLLFDRLRTSDGEAYLTIVGPASMFAGEELALAAVRDLHPHLTVQRCEIDGEEGQLRVRLHRVEPESAPNLIAELRSRLPDCQISYVNSAGLL
ncbi:MAG: DUF4956 domain-containing protein [Planctomycetota bacterium]